MKIIFNNISLYKKGLIKDLLLKSYESIPTTSGSDKKSFLKFDQDLSIHPNWLGKNVFITSVDDMPVGFVSFNPRKIPTAEIGHNCITPERRGLGLGVKQMNEAISEIKRQGFKKIIVSTSNNEYFIPAQKMYKSCGFTETGKFYKEGSDIEMIEYELNLITFTKS